MSYPRLQAMTLLAAIVGLLGCGGLNMSPALAAPPNLSLYSDGLVDAVVGTPITPDIPIGGSRPLIGGPVPLTPATYSISPALPQGLSLDSANGVISGTPLVASPATGYTVTASNSSGSVSTWLQITVHAEGAPYGLSYGSSQITGVTGTALAPDLAHLQGTAQVAFTVSPGLPLGLNLDPVSGTLSGTPTLVSPQAQYLVTASNSFGSTSCSLQVEVVAPSAPVFTQSASLALVAGTPALAFRLQITSLPAVQSFAVAPALPLGLVLDPGTGTLSGTPESPSPLTVYTVSATNAAGTAYLPLVLSVNPAGWPIIAGFTASPATLRYGQQATLSWYVPNTNQVNINGLTIDPDLYDGTFVVTPAPGSNSYRLTATNGLGTATAQIAVDSLP